MTKTASLRGVAALLGIVLLLVACGDGGQAQGESAEADPTAGTDAPTTGEATASPEEVAAEPFPVTFAFVGQAVSPLAANFTAGIELGYYEEEGIGPVEIIAMSDFAAQTAALGSGDVQLAVGSPTFMLNQAASGEEQPGIAYYAYTYPFKYDWAVAPDSEIQSASELAGMTVGVDDLGRIAPIIAEALLEDAGVEYDSVSVIATGGGVTGGQALEAGEIDVMLADDTMLGQWEVAGIDYRLLERPEEVPLIGSFYIATTQELMDERPDVVIGFARAVAKGSVFVSENLECGAAIFLKQFPQAAPQGASTEEAIDDIATIVGKRAPLWSPENIGESQWGVTIPEMWAAEVQYQGIEAEEELYADLYTNEFIEEINDFDVEAVREAAQACDPSEYAD